jgi:hypothetical protein
MRVHFLRTATRRLIWTQASAGAGLRRLDEGTEVWQVIEQNIRSKEVDTVLGVVSALCSLQGL